MSCIFSLSSLHSQAPVLRDQQLTVAMEFGAL